VRVEDLMTRDVVSVTPNASLKTVAETLVEHGISGVPVCESDGTVLGVVSEADILVREGGRPENTGRLFGWVIDAPLSGGVAKADAQTAAQAMTSPAITISWNRPAAAAARTMIERGINRLMVVDAVGKLVGIVTRADLVRAFARTDEAIETEVRKDVLRHTLWAEPGGVDVTVEAGEVELQGQLETKTDVELLEAFVERVPGVVAVHSSVGYRIDDTKHNPRFARIV
jgi:CBS domain-containing protein